MKKLISSVLLFATMAFASVANAGLIEAFEPTDTDGVNDTSGALITVEYGEWLTSNGISYGWYLTDTDSNSVLDTMGIFNGADGFLSGSTITWDYTANTVTATNGNMLDWTGLTGNWELGAYFEYDGTSIFSHDALNPGGLDLVDINQIDFAGFDLSMGFHDDAWGWKTGIGGIIDDIGQVVYVSDVQPWESFGSTSVEVPEPSSVAILSAGLLGLGLARRRKNKLSK